MAKRTPQKPPNAAAVIEAAAGLATHTIAGAAAEATKTLATAANVALQTLATAATKAVEDFPRIQEDIRELRQAHVGDVAVVTATVTALIERHTLAEEDKLKAIALSMNRIEAHLSTQNGRLSKVEIASGRQNLVIYGMVGPSALAFLGYALTKLF